MSDPLRIMIQANHPFLGDCVKSTATVRDLRAAQPDAHIGIITKLPAVFDHNPDVDEVHGPNSIKRNGVWWRDRYEAEGWIIYAHQKSPGDHLRLKYAPTYWRGPLGGGDPHILSLLTAGSHALNDTFAMGLRELGHFPAIYLSDQERAERPQTDPYWLVVTGGRLQAKVPPSAVMQQILSSTPEINWIKIGTGQHGLLASRTLSRRLPATLNLRDLFRWVFHAKGVLCSITSFMHVAAALGTPCVVVAGGRELPEWVRYQGQSFFHSIGQLPCCAFDGCWEHNCRHPVDRQCFRLLVVGEIVEAIRFHDRYQYCRTGLPQPRPTQPELAATTLARRLWDNAAFPAEWKNGSRSQRLWEYCEALKAIAPKAGQVILDCGGGQGYLSAVLALAGCRAIYLDALPKYQQPVRPWLVLRGRAEAPATYRVHRNMVHRPLAGALDAIACVSVIEHVDDAAALVTTLASILRPGGRLAITTEYHPTRQYKSAQFTADLAKAKILSIAAKAGLRLSHTADCPVFARDSRNRWKPRLWAWEKPSE